MVRTSIRLNYTVTINYFGFCGNTTPQPIWILIIKTDVTLGPYYYRETNPEPGQGNVHYYGNTGRY
jgi:hypothetical protein